MKEDRKLSKPEKGPLGLEVLQLLHDLVLMVYRTTDKVPQDERFGLVAQIRRSAASIPTNIVEGRNRGSTKEFVRQLHIARGSLAETEYHLLISRDLGYLKESDYSAISADYVRAGQMLNGLIRSLQDSPRPLRAPGPGPLAP